MIIEEYIKQQLSAKNISLHDAAQVLGYASQSLRNKLVRHSLNIHDVFLLGMMLEQKFMLADESDTPTFIFSWHDYLSEEDDKRLTQFRNKRSNKLDFCNWMKSLDLEKNKALSNGLKRTEEEMLQLCASKSCEGVEKLLSENFTHIIVINGLQCKEAKKWLEERIKIDEPEDEYIYYVACERIFDVYICFESPARKEIIVKNEKIQSDVKHFNK